MKISVPFCGRILLLFLGVGILNASASTPVSTYSISVLADRDDATYHVGDPVTFNVMVSHDGAPVNEGSVDWSLSQDGVAPFEQGSAPIQAGHAIVKGQLAMPGFLQCKISFKREKENIRALGGAAIDPLKISPSLPVPDDFDAFWTEEKLRLKKVPINARMSPVPTTVPGIELFDVQADAIGVQPMRGYYARPIGAKPKSLPAIITLEGAGVYSTRLGPTDWAKEGFISLELNAHGIPNGNPPEYYQALNEGTLKDYQLIGRNSRDTFYFLNMYLRDLRGLDFLTSQPEWDGRILIANGGSQGAAQAIFLTAEDPRITFLTARVPAMCDHSGMLAGRIAGWPKLIPNGADGKPDPAVLETSRYFDSVNFASRIRVPSLFVAGFIDQTAPPTSVYAAYNNISAEKQMYPAIHSPHKLGPEIEEYVHKQILLRK